MAVHQIDPICDPRWMEFVHERPDSSVFHSPNWLRALQATYSYHPFVLTTSPPRAKLQNGMVFCRVESWLTGNRLVSVPFADHCEILVDNAADRCELLSFVAGILSSNQFKYAELRPTRKEPEDECGFRLSRRYALHTLDLRPGLEEILKKSHKTSIQQKIRRAQRQELDYTEGNDSQHIRRFYQLLLLTRRRQKIPPQPLEWFHNLAKYFGESLQIRLLLKGGQPIAGVLTLRWKNTVVDKYSCSDAQGNNLGCIPLLLWRVIEHAKKTGINTFDLGRSDYEGTGLVEFKDRWGSQRAELKYWRLPSESVSSGDDWKLRVAGPIFARMPNLLLATSGRILYRHIG